MAELKKVEVIVNGITKTIKKSKGFWKSVLSFNEVRKEIKGSVESTTQNRITMIAIIESLKKLKEPCRVVITTNSTYLYGAIAKKWLNRWLNNGWMTTKKTPVKNQDLWKELIELANKHKVSFIWDIKTKNASNIAPDVVYEKNK